MSGGSSHGWSQAGELRGWIPFFALGVGIIAAVSDASSLADPILVAIPVVAFAVWAYAPGIPLWALSVAVLAPVVVAQRDGQLEPLLFEASLLAFVVGRWAPSWRTALVPGLLAFASPIAASLIQDPPEIAVGIWLLGIAFPFGMGRAAARERELAGELEATRRELAEQALLEERRRIARDIHDLVGHGLVAAMVQITSARHVLRRDPAEADEALRSAEDVGRRSMRELRSTVTLLRGEDEAALPPPVPAASDIPTLVDTAQASGIAVELRRRGDLSQIAPSVGLALYRISQEALANAARHAPQARTILGLELANGDVSLVAETIGPVDVTTPSEPERPRYGLIGMRERATALGGDFTAGPTEGGWLVSCRLPVQAEEPTLAEEAGAP